MSRRFTRAALAAALINAFVISAARADAELDAVVVTATRQPTRTDEQLADVTVLDRSAIEDAGATTVPELLARQPGLQVTSDGGIGKTGGLFIRGTNTGHTLLLVDGMPLGSATLGEPSLQNLPLAQIERIEILRGPASSLYGSDAIGGVIQVFTRRGEGPAKPEAFVGAGSYGTWQAGGGISGGSELVSYSLRANRLATAGFNVGANVAHFQAANFGTSPNMDADGYSNTSWSGKIAVRPMAGQEFGATLMTADSINHFDSGSDATIDARNEDQTRVLTLYSRNRLSESWTSMLRYGESRDASRIYDFDWTLFAPAWARIATTQRQWTWQNDLHLPLGSLLLAAEQKQQAVDSTIGYPIKERTIRSLIAGWSGAWGAHRWQVSQRVDDNSQFGAKTTGSVAYGYRLSSAWQARAAYGTAFKAPSFNDLYWPGAGNPNLKPETASNREIGLDWHQGEQQVGVTAFDNRITNLITWVPPAWLPANVGHARITGLSLSYGLTRAPWQVAMSLDLQRPIDADTGNRLQLRAAQIGKFSLVYSPDAWSVGLEADATGARYDSTTQTRPLPGYGVVNIFARYRLDPATTLEGRLNNLFDKVYETAYGFAMPRANLFVGLRYQPK